MKKLFAVIIISCALIQVINAQAEKQQITEIDKIVLDIKNNMNSYRKILNETDSIMKSENTNSNLTETAFKKGKELVLVQYIDLYGHMKSADYYFNNGQLIFIDIKNRDNSYEKAYFNDNKLIAKYRNENEADKNAEEFKQIEEATLLAISKEIKRYENK
jgi:hypothetical protein